MSGYFLTYRSIFDHPRFARDVYSQRDAWLWLISTACYEPKKVAIMGKYVILERGQLSFSTRFLAAKWRWTKQKTHRFLLCLKSDTMIDTATVTGQLVITICNYDNYQIMNNESVTAGVTAGVTPPLRPRYASGTNKKEYKELKELKEKNPPTPQGVLGDDFKLEVVQPESDDRFGEFWDTYGKKESRPRAQAAYTRALAKTSAETIIDGARIYIQQRRDADKREQWRQYLPHPATWLNNEKWNDIAPEIPDEQLSEIERIRRRTGLKLGSYVPFDG